VSEASTTHSGGSRPRPPPSPSSLPAQALREYAESEEIGLSIAAQNYLDQLRGRSELIELPVSLVSSPGIDLAADIAEYGRERGVDAVVVPAHVARLDPGFIPRIAMLMHIPVTVVPSVP